jgi:hypothetical protein
MWLFFSISVCIDALILVGQFVFGLGAELLEHRCLLVAPWEDI